MFVYNRQDTTVRKGGWCSRIMPYVLEHRLRHTPPLIAHSQVVKIPQSSESIDVDGPDAVFAQAPVPTARIQMTPFRASNTIEDVAAA